MRVAVLGPGGVGGLIAGAARSGRHPGARGRPGVATAEAIAERGLRVDSVSFGEFVAHPRARRAPAGAGRRADRRDQGRRAGVGARSASTAPPKLVLPLLNGLDHIAVLRGASRAGSVLAGAIRVEADRPEPGVVVHTSPFLLVDMASHDRRARPGCRRSRRRCSTRALAVRVRASARSESEAQVMWSKLVRLNALACTTSAFDKLLGEIRSTPELRADAGRRDRGGLRGRARRGRA